MNVPIHLKPAVAAAVAAAAATVVVAALATPAFASTAFASTTFASSTFANSTFASRGAPSSGYSGGSHAVFVQTDAVSGNHIVAYHRAADGTLSPVGSYPTGGLGGILGGSAGRPHGVAGLADL